jgi:RHS repeat-associated protein
MLSAARDYSLDYANNRYYSNAYGRFMTPDPYTASGGPGNPRDPQSWNRYAYTRGDPVNGNDPSGLLTCSTDPDDASLCQDEDNGVCDPSYASASCDFCYGADGFLPTPSPGCPDGGQAQSGPPATPLPCYDNLPKVDTTLVNLGQDIIGITALKDPAATAGDSAALSQTISSDVSQEMAAETLDPAAYFDGGHFSLNLDLESVAQDLGGMTSLAYQDFKNLFDPNGNGRRYPTAVPTTDPSHSYYLHDHSTNDNEDLSFHFDRFNPYHHFPLGTVLHGAVDVLYGNLGAHCLDPAWR